MAGVRRTVQRGFLEGLDVSTRRKKRDEEW
jgi:hypothetical protein